MIRAKSCWVTQWNLLQYFSVALKIKIEMQKPSKKVQNRPYFSLRFFARVRHILAYNFWTDSHFFIILLASVVTVLNFADKYETGFFILVLIFLAKLKHKCQNLFRSIVISKACFQHFDP